MSVLLALLLVSAGDALADCRRLDHSFDTKAMPAPCTAAVDDVARPLPDRTEAARLLAFALFTNGDVDGAETAFLRMLALSPKARLPEGSSPRLADVLSRATIRFQSEGIVLVNGSARAGSAGAVGFDADIVDAFGRTIAVRGVLLSGGAVAREVPLTLLAQRWSGEGPPAAQVVDGCRVEALDAGGGVVGSGSCVVPAGAGAPEAELPWLWSGVAGAAVVVVVAAVGVGVGVAATTPPVPATVTVRIE